ncbi:MAG: arylesterase [Deltaproteobacteria bacterium]|nr:arylesterase [Deltaproteobacteria bacterium]
MFRLKNALCLTMVLVLSSWGSACRADTPQYSTRNSGQGKAIVFFGDSLTAGFGLDPAQAFPALIQEKIKQRGWGFQVVNAGLSGETTAGGVRRIEWVLQRPIDIFVLELGANDGLRGLPVEQAKVNLQTIMDKVRDKYPSARIVLVGMQIPANLGRAYVSQFREVFPELAKKNRVPLIPFLLEGVGGIPALNLPDGIHPAPAGHKIVAENVWKILEPVLEEVQ